jgi:hypothetical protein
VAAVPPLGDWRDAAAFVRESYQEGDLAVVAPDWANPILRWVMGDALDRNDAGRSDTAPYDRLWSLSIRGEDPAEAPGEAPDVDRQVGSVRVRRWDLGSSPVVYDFVPHIADARVSYVDRGRERACSLRRHPLPPGGGLSRGPLRPTERFICDPKRSWSWVGRVMLTDLGFGPRDCVWTHPLGTEPVHVTFDDVPLGDRIVFYGGIYYTAERKGDGGPVHVQLSVDGRPVGHMIHRNGDGWKRMEAQIPGSEGGDRRGTVRFSVTSKQPYHRMFCWSATTRKGPRR